GLGNQNLLILYGLRDGLRHLQLLGAGTVVWYIPGK
ncbi:MAG: hypothetical protein UZ02_AOB001001064, partial [Nitrosomonas europaea]